MTPSESISLASEGKAGRDGKIGGLSTSPMKVAAARENDKNGGRPKKSSSK